MDWPAVRDCSVIGIRAGDSSGVASKPGGVPVVGEVEVVAELEVVAEEVPVGEAVAEVVGEEVPVGEAVVVAEVPLVAGALEAGALATGTMTATPARTAPKAARRARGIECAGGGEDEPTRARYAGA
jgi:hypothetical protein